MNSLNANEALIKGLLIFLLLIKCIWFALQIRIPEIIRWSLIACYIESIRSFLDLRCWQSFFLILFEVLILIWIEVTSSQFLIFKETFFNHSHWFYLWIALRVCPGRWVFSVSLVCRNRRVTIFSYFKSWRGIIFLMMREFLTCLN